MAQSVGVPTTGGFKDAMVDYGYGFGGGLLYALSSSLFGSGLIGGLLGAGIAGSVIRGTRGTVLATVLGFQTIVGAASAQPAASASQTQEVM